MTLDNTGSQVTAPVAFGSTSKKYSQFNKRQT